MRRRDFIKAIAVSSPWPIAALAQQASGVKRLGALMSLGENDPEGKAQLSGFTQALAALGWIEGRNLRMDVRWAGGDANRARIFA